uniref:Isochorismatase domain containing 2 n=1 Tax=Ornithorhynchus anatinus TaxID=9258 RepID=A0A6I8N2R9_ORNAN
MLITVSVERLLCSRHCTKRRGRYERIGSDPVPVPRSARGPNPRFPDGGTEARRSEATCPRSTAEPGLEPVTFRLPVRCSLHYASLSSPPSPRQAARILEVPVVLTEQYPQGLGPTVPELGAGGLRPLSKTCFSMVTAEVERELEARPGLRSVLLCGIEAQACIMSTALDLLDRGLDVHVVADACSSRSQVDRLLALSRMRQSGAFLTTSESLILQLVRDAAHPRFKEVQKLIKHPAPDSGLLALFQGQGSILG